MTEPAEQLRARTDWQGLIDERGEIPPGYGRRDGSWLRGLSRPQYRLRVGDDVRVFYDVTEDAVEVLAIVPKSEVNDWLERYGETDEESSPD